MCLFTHQKEPVTSNKDIKCYKVVRKCTDKDNNVYYMPLFNFTHNIRYYLGMTVDMNDSVVPRVKDIFKSEKNEIKVNEKHFTHPYKVEEGLHSFTNKNTFWKSVARWGIKNIEIDDKWIWEDIFKDVRITVIECVIPAGVPFFTGEHNCLPHKNDRMKEMGYCSTKLKFVKEIPDNKWRIEYSDEKNTYVKK